MKNINLNTISKFTKKVICGGIACAGYVVGLGIIGSHIVTDEIKITSFGYHEAVKAILDSDMWESDKAKTINVIKRDGDKEYYKTIIEVANSDMWESDKFDVISKL